MVMNCPLFSRAALLALSLLSACAAANAEDPPGGGAASRPIVGASGAFLVGRYAMGRTDLDVATDDFLKALAADPQNTELQQQAFDAALLVGRPEALSLARQLSLQPGRHAGPRRSGRAHRQLGRRGGEVRPPCRPRG